MPRKRRNAKARAQIGPDALDAFKAGRWMDLHRALGLRPWEASPLDATAPEPPSWAACDASTAWAASWPRAYALRTELVA